MTKNNNKKEQWVEHVTPAYAHTKKKQKETGKKREEKKKSNNNNNIIITYSSPSMTPPTWEATNSAPRTPYSLFFSFLFLKTYLFIYSLPLDYLS